MKQKIEWYKEVLEIEPNSKIFFPLARMLAKDGRVDEAITVLRQGVGRHPDHIEARLLLAELVYVAGRPVELQQELAVLSSLFTTYPGFWRAWGERLFEEDNTRDAGLAAIFLSAFLQNASVSWSGVIEQGLKGLLSGENFQSAFVSAAGVGPKKAPVSAPDPVPAEQESTDESALLDDIAEAAPERQEELPTVPMPEPVLTAAANVLADDLEGDDEEDEDSDEPITLRTRSMADILAEQGDIHGALDIYNDLLLSARTEEEQKQLQDVIARLSGSLSAPHEQAQPEGAGEEKNRLTDMLEILAQRLEARSLQ